MFCPDTGLWRYPNGRFAARSTDRLAELGFAPSGDKLDLVDPERSQTWRRTVAR